MQTYEPLIINYDITAFGSLHSFHKTYKFPAKYLLSPVDILNISNLLIPQRFTLGVLNRLFVDSHYLFGLEKNLIGFDIAHTAETYYHFTRQAISAKEKGQVKKVVVTVWENIPFNNEGIRSRKRFKKDVLENADHFIAVSGLARDALVKEGCSPDKITVISPGIDTKLFKPVKKKNNSIVNILFCGRLEDEKGIFDILKAIKELKKENLQFFFVGKGTEEEKMRRLEEKWAISHLIKHTALPYDKMPEVYDKADIFIAPSKNTKYWQEQFGMSILEAMASGLPIITANSGAIPENVGNAALLIEPGDWKTLALTIKKLSQDIQLRETLGKKARKRAVKHYDIHVVAQKIDQIYKNLFT